MILIAEEEAKVNPKPAEDVKMEEVKGDASEPTPTIVADKVEASKDTANGLDEIS